MHIATFCFKTIQNVEKVSQIDPKIVGNFKCFQFLTFLLTLCAIIKQAGTSPSLLPVKFPKLAKDISLKLLPSLSIYSKVTRKITPETRKSPLPKQGKPKPIFWFFGKNTIVPKRVSACEKLFTKPEIALKARSTVQPDESFGKTHRGEKSWKEVFSTIIQKTHQLYRIKKQQRGQPQDSEAYFLYRKLQIPKIANWNVSKIVFGKKFQGNFP